MYTPFAHAFAYAIKQTPYAFVLKIILCMYSLYGNTASQPRPRPSMSEMVAIQSELVGMHFEFEN